MSLILASRSPRRAQLLQQLGVSFQIVDVDVPEVPDPAESALAYVQRVTADKAAAGRTQWPQHFVLAADTEVVLDGRVFGKPADAADAARMLRELSARTHQVISAVALAGPEGTRLRVQCTEVEFSALDDRAISEYVASGEPMGKAGAYAIQGRAAAFIPRIAGSYTSVMGLPLFETAGLLAEVGLLA